MTSKNCTTCGELKPLSLFHKNNFNPDTVVFKKYSPDEIDIDGKEYLVVDEDDILAVIA